MDTKAKVALGDYARGGKTRTDANGQVTKGWDHDPPAKEKQVPFGILMVVAGALTLLFGSRETSDVWADALQMWWQHVRAFYGHIKRLVIYHRAYAPLFQGLRTTFPCVFEGFSLKLSSHYIIHTNCNALYSPIHYRKVASM